MVTIVRVALGSVSVAIAGMVLRSVVGWLEPLGAWAPLLWFGLLVVVSYVLLAALEWVIGGVPSARHRPRSTR